MGPNNALPFDLDMAHSIGSEALEELASAYALEALSAEEQAGYTTHLGTCSFCRNLANQFQAVADSLPLALEEEVGSPGLKERIFHEVRREAGPQADPDGEPSESIVGRLGQLFGGMMPRRVVAPGAVIVLVLALFVWNVILQVGPDNGGGLSTDEQLFIQTISQGSPILQLPGTENAPNSAATLVSHPEGTATLILVRNLPALPSGREFEVWKIIGGIPTSAGTFATDDDSDRIITLFSNLLDADSVAISIEVVGGSPTGSPLGDIVVAGDL